MRYIVKWSNGFWKLFDTQTYRDVGIFDTLKDAAQAEYEALPARIRQKLREIY